MKLSEYIGHEKQVALAKNFMEGWMNNKPFAKAAILSGPPGVGKTSLSSALAYEYRTPLVRHNLSRDRSVAHIRALRNSSTTQAMGGGLKLLFIDEADHMTKSLEKEVLELIKESKSPIILACNYIQKIPLPIRKACMEIAFQRPTIQDLMKYAIEVYADDPGITKSSAEVMRIVQQCRSFRQVKHLLENGAPVYDADSFVEDEGSMVEALFKGQDLGLKAHQGQDLILWVRDNTTTPEVAELADQMFAMNRRVGRPLGEQACQVLSLATGSIVSYPWSLRARRAAPKKVKAKTESKKIPTRGRGALKLQAGVKDLSDFF